MVEVHTENVCIKKSAKMRFEIILIPLSILLWPIRDLLKNVLAAYWSATRYIIHDKSQFKTPILSFHWPPLFIKSASTFRHVSHVPHLLQHPQCLPPS